MKKKYYVTFAGLIFIFLGYGIFEEIPQNMNHYQAGDYIILFLMYALFLFLAIVLLKKAFKPQNSIAKSQNNLSQSNWDEGVKKAAQITGLPVVSFPEAILLKPDEVCHYQSFAKVGIVKNQVTGRTGGYGGVSFRIAKGVTLHSGSSGGKSIRENVLYTYPGIFSMTNQRIIMTGEKGFEYPIAKLTAMTPYQGKSGITLQFGKISHSLLMSEPYWVPKIIDLLALDNRKEIENGIY